LMSEMNTVVQQWCLFIVAGVLCGCGQEQSIPASAQQNAASVPGEPSPGFLGIFLVDPDSETLVVKGFVSGSPAETSGVKVGDRILRLHRQRNPTFQQLQLIVAAKNSGDRIGIRVGRQDEELEYEIQLTSSAFVQRSMEEQATR
jgi:S1-C subfamily serine protease